MLLPGLGAPLSAQINHRPDLPVQAGRAWHFDQMTELPSEFTFTRGSIATYFDSSGTLQTTPIGNFLLYSEEFDNANWQKNGMTISADATTDPLSGSTADKLVENAASGTKRVLDAGTDVENGEVYTFSVYAKAGERNWIVLRSNVLSFFSKAFFDLSTGTIGTVGVGVTAAIEDVGSGWYRCSYTMTSNTTTGRQSGVYLADGDNSDSYTGDGTSGVFVWGAQLNKGSSAGTYAATTSSQASNAPRFGHVYDGVTNLILQSNGFDTTWTNTNSIDESAQGTSPDGTNNAWKITDDSSTGTGQVYVSQTVTLTNAAYTVSVFAKADQLSKMSIGTSNFTTTGTSWFDLALGTTLTLGHTSSGIESAGNGWYRCWITWTPGADAAGEIRIRPAETDSVGTVDLDGTSSILIYGAQIVRGSSPLEYVATTTTVAYSGSWVPKGLLIEGARTNSLLNNRDLSGTGWSDAGVAGMTAVTGIDGSSKTINLTDNNTGSREGRQQDVTVSNDSATHTVSCFVKKTTGVTYYPCVQATFQDGSTPVSGEVAINTNTGATGQHSAASDATNINVEDYGDWWRLWYNITNNSTGHVRLTIVLRPGQTNDALWPERANNAWPSDADNLPNNTFDFPQVELNVSYPSSPMETDGGTFARSADVCTLTGLDTAAWFDTTQGTIFFEATKAYFNTNNPRMLTFHDGTANERIYIYTNSTTPNIRMQVVDGGAGQGPVVSPSGQGTAADNGETFKVASVYATNDLALSAEGNPADADTTATIPTMTTMTLGSDWDGGDVSFSHISKIIYWPTRLSDDRLVGLSA